MANKLFISLIGICLSMCACQSGTNVKGIYGDAEKSFSTDTSTTKLMHAALYHPREVSLDFPGFIVGIEKSPRSVVSSKEDWLIASPEGSHISESKVKKRILDSKIHYISHIVKNFGEQHGKGNCAIYNAYYMNKEILKNKEGIQAPLMICDDYKVNHSDQFHNFEAKNYRTGLYSHSWQALERLKKDLKKQLISSEAKDKYTHIVVLTMGWNTGQVEAIRNFNSIISSIKVASECEKKYNRNCQSGEFRPLFIGVTWPSLWVNDWLQPIIQGFSFTNKAKDADEVGLMWLGEIIHGIIPSLGIDLPVVAIGHSFGARAMVTATCAGPAIFYKEGLKPSWSGKAKDLTLISLQGAFPINRFTGSNKSNKSNKKLSFKKNCEEAATKVLSTSSINDKAVTKAIYTSFAGSYKVFQNFCGKENTNKKYSCAVAKSNGELNLINKHSSNLVFINAEKLIKYNAYQSGGGAHSDIYRNEHGQFIWNIINRKNN